MKRYNYFLEKTLVIGSVFLIQSCGGGLKMATEGLIASDQSRFDASTRLVVASRISRPTEFIDIVDPCVLSQQGISDSINAAFGITPPDQWDGCYHLKVELLYAYRAIAYSGGQAVATVTQYNGVVRQANFVQDFNNQMVKVDQVLTTKFSDLSPAERHELKALTFSYVGSAWEMVDIDEPYRDRMVQEINVFIDRYTNLGPQGRIKKPVFTPEFLQQWAQFRDTVFDNITSSNNPGSANLPQPTTVGTSLNSAIPNFNERRYTECDIALNTAVTNADLGTRQSAAAHNMSVAGLHFHMFGRQEGRDPKGEKCLLAQEVPAYLNCYSDIKAAQLADTSRTSIKFAQDHYRAFGFQEIQEGRRARCSFLTSN